MIKSKILYILRHAKAEVGTSTQDDHERPLMERGIKAAENMGKYLVKHGIAPDLAICSTAERASQTWENILTAYKVSPPLEYSEKAYLASGNELLNIITEVPETVGSLLVIAHNPGLHQLCLKLSKDGDEELLDTMMLKFPTCAFAAISLDKIEWQDIARADGELKMFVTPKSIAA